MKLAQRPMLTQSLTTAVSSPYSLLSDIYVFTSFYRYYSRPATSWPSKRSRKSGQGTTTSRAQGEWRSTVAVPNPKPLPPRIQRANASIPQPSAVFGPVATTWFKFLQHKIVLKNPNTTIAARVLTDQVVFASTNLFVFLSSMAIMEGSSPRDKLKSTYTTALQKNWMVWPWVQAINFKLVPLEHRVMVVNVVALGMFWDFFVTEGPWSDARFADGVLVGWNCYLSYLNSKK